MNNQKPWPLNTDPKKIMVHSIFATIQGEGPFVGQPSIFVRLAGCNLQCPLCDTEYTVPQQTFSPPHLITAIKAKIGRRGNPNTPLPLVVLTGGEPFRQNLEELLRALLGEGFRVQVETNGTIFRGLQLATATNPNFTIVCSPKLATVNARLQAFIDSYKYIVKSGELNAFDGLPERALDLEPGTKGLLFRPPTDYPNENIYLQPLDEPGVHKSVHREAAIISCLKFGYTLSIQIHKELGLP